MRRLKFRAWIEASRTMFYFPGPLVDLDTPNLMQFTGLLDKNGKEIYEGDVVRIGCDDERGINGVHVIEFWNGQFVFNANRLFQRFQQEDYINFGWWVRSNEGKMTLKQIEILGNIYEHPSLLTEPEGTA